MLNQIGKCLLNIQHDGITGAAAILEWDPGWASEDFTDVEAVREPLRWVDGENHNPGTFVCQFERQGRTTCGFTNPAGAAAYDDICSHSVAPVVERLLANRES